MIELRPCPFCGGRAELNEHTGYGWRTVQCVECCASTSEAGVYTAAEAAARWNRRAADQPDAVSTNSPEVSSELVVPFYYRLQDKRDPYRHMNFDPSAWNFILVPAVPGEGVVGYSAADNSPAAE